jgi:hypothetical protein
MSYESIKDPKEVKCRKKHGCAWCGEKINIGDKAVSRAYKFEGSFLSDYLHPECWGALLDTDSLYLEDGFTEGDQERGRPLDQDR